MKRVLLLPLLTSLFIFMTPLQAENYKIDIKGQHAFIQFKIKHLGYSWLLGRFNKFDGSFSYDEKNPAAAKVKVTIDVASIDSNHAERDKHLRDKRFFDVKNFPTAKFESTSFEEKANGKAVLVGNLSLHGVTKSISLDVEHIGAGKDPWGGYRRGFAATTKLVLTDFNINTNLGPATKEAELFLSIEGIRQ